MVSGETSWQRREGIGFNDGHQGGNIKRTAARRCDDSGISITAVLVYIKDNSRMALKFLEMRRDVPLSFDAFLDLIGIFPQGKSLGVEEPASGALNSLLFVFKYFVGFRRLLDPFRNRARRSVDGCLAFCRDPGGGKFITSFLPEEDSVRTVTKDPGAVSVDFPAGDCVSATEPGAVLIDSLSRQR